MLHSVWTASRVGFRGRRPQGGFLGTENVISLGKQGRAEGERKTAASWGRGSVDKQTCANEERDCSERAEALPVGRGGWHTTGIHPSLLNKDHDTETRHKFHL